MLGQNIWKNTTFIKLHKNLFTKITTKNVEYIYIEQKSITDRLIFFIHKNVGKKLSRFKKIQL